MCNLYSYTKGQAAIRELARAMHDRTGNLPPMPGIFPDYPAPIVRNGADGRELVMARWGMPSPGNVLMEATRKRVQKLEAKGKTVDFKEMLRAEPDAGVTNVRNADGGYACACRWPSERQAKRILCNSEGDGPEAVAR